MTRDEMAKKLAARDTLEELIHTAIMAGKITPNRARDCLNLIQWPDADTIQEAKRDANP